MKFTLAQWTMIRDCIQRRVDSLEDTVKYYQEKRCADHMPKVFLEDLATCRAILDKLDALDI